MTQVTQVMFFSESQTLKCVYVCVSVCVHAPGSAVVLNEAAVRSDEEIPRPDVEAD